MMINCVRLQKPRTHWIFTLSVLYTFSQSPLLFSEDKGFVRVIKEPKPSTTLELENDKFLYGTEVIYLDLSQSPPTKPAKVPGTAWHLDPKHALYVIGDTNPNLRHPDLMREIEFDKGREAAILMNSVPEHFPKTENMLDVLKALGLSNQGLDPKNIPQIEAALRSRYPQGFYLKPVDSFDTDGNFPTDKVNLTSLHYRFLRNAKPIQEELQSKITDPDRIHIQMKQVPDYEGRIVDAILSHPESVIIQERMRPKMTEPIKIDGKWKQYPREYRVHVVEGKVLPGGTVPRWMDGWT